MCIFSDYLYGIINGEEWVMNMASIEIEKGTLKSSIDSFKSASTTLSSTADDGSSTLGSVKDHSEIKGISSAASNIASSLTALSKDYKCLSGNLVNYISSVEEIDGEAAAEEEMEFERLTKSALSAVTFIGGEYKNGGTVKANEKQAAFINSLVKGAMETYKKYGVLPSLTMAQAILESGWGESGLSANYNNLFGIKAGDSWNGKVANLGTAEQNSDGSYYNITAAFRAYDDVADSIEDHGKLLSNDRYKPVIAAKDYKEACVRVRECGYATSLNYSQNLINLIEQYGLNQWDK